MTRDEKLDRLCRIAALMADQALAPIAAARSDIEEGEKIVNNIMSHRQRLSQDAADPSYAARSTEQIARLHRLQGTRLMNLAAARATLEIAKGAAKPAVARQHALEALRDREIAKRRKSKRSS